jgi:hypothetical protein
MRIKEHFAQFDSLRILSLPSKQKVSNSQERKKIKRTHETLNETPRKLALLFRVRLEKRLEPTHHLSSVGEIDEERKKEATNSFKQATISQVFSGFLLGSIAHNALNILATGLIWSLLEAAEEGGARAERPLNWACK